MSMFIPFTLSDLALFPRMKPTPGPWLYRLWQAWYVFRGQAIAVRYPLDDITEQHIIMITHDLGLHKKSGYAQTDCADCFWEAYNSYKEDCIGLLAEYDVEQVIPFLDYYDRINLDDSIPLGERWWTFHEHPLYAVGDFLGFNHHTGGHETESFKNLEAIYDRLHPYPPELTTPRTSIIRRG